MDALWEHISIMMVFKSAAYGLGQLSTWLFAMYIVNLTMVKGNIIMEDRSRDVKRLGKGLSSSTGQPPPVNVAIPCSCNLPKCARFGYMCKSFEGVCFVYYNETRSNLLGKSALRPYLYPLQGCIEDLPQKAKESCKQQATSGAEEFGSSDVKREGLTCCAGNVCNYQEIPVKRRHDYVQRRAEPANTIRMSTEFFAGVCVVAVPIVGGIMFMLFLCLGRKMLLEERMYSPVQKNDDISQTCHHGATFVPCGMPEPVTKYGPLAYLHRSQLDYIAYKNAAYSFSGSSYLSRSLPDLNMPS